MDDWKKYQYHTILKHYNYNKTVLSKILHIKTQKDQSWIFQDPYKPYQTDPFFLPSQTCIMFPLLHLEQLPLDKMKSLSVHVMRGLTAAKYWKCQPPGRHWSPLIITL